MPHPRWSLIRLAVLLVMAAGFISLPAAAARPWDAVTMPTPGPSQAIGSTSLGCLAGGRPLAAEGEGFATVRRWRGRYYGTEDLLIFLTRLGRDGRKAGLPPLLIGDMAQPRGGPLPYGHASHQSGIDVDILFTMGPMAASDREAMTEHPPSMLAADGVSVDRNRFGPTQIATLKRAASDPQTARIFVNFHIKAYLCTSLPATGRGWLHKLRPWLGHDEHFHVRLLCPTGSPACVEQGGIPPGDGCDASLEAWFKPAPKPAKPIVPAPKPRLPAACVALLAAAP